MKTVKFEFTEYDVTDCRFGRPVKGTDTRKALPETIGGFHSWIQKAQRLTDTKIESPGDDLYVKESASASGLYCFVLWKRVGTNREVYAISADDPPNAGAKVKVRKFDETDIPGEPLYFIVNPMKCSLFCVRPSGMQRLGLKDMTRAVQFFMGIRSKRVSTNPRVTETGDDEMDVAWPDGNPMFAAHVKRKKSVLDRVLENPGGVTNLVHTIPLKDKGADERLRIIKPFLGFFHQDLAGENFERTRSVTYKISIDGLQRGDVEKAIKTQENAAPGQKVGFRMRNSSQTIWADDCLMRRSIDLEIDAGNGVFAASGLLDAASKAIPDWL